MPIRLKVSAVCRVFFLALLSVCVWARPVSARAPGSVDVPPTPVPAPAGVRAAASSAPSEPDVAAAPEAETFASSSLRPEPDPGAAEPDSEADRVARVLEWRARIMTGFELERVRPAGAQTRPARQEYGFVAKQLRLGVRGELNQHFRANLSFDLSDTLAPKSGTYTKPALLRTATFEYRQSRAFRLQVGRFKRPFSALELTSAADLPILNRGLFNDLAIQDNQWGDRAIGMQVSGRLKAPKLRWYLSLTNPGWSSALAYQGIDVIGRLQLALSKAVSLGLDAGYKNIDAGNTRVDGTGWGGDVTLQLGAAHLLLEGGVVDLLLAERRPRAFGALVLFDYSIQLRPGLALMPTFFGELADADAKLSETESVRLVFGVNLIVAEQFRIMPQLGLVRSLGDTSQLNPWLESETYTLIFSLVL
jgi:phosphate-selective porin O/P